MHPGGLNVGTLTHRHPPRRSNMTTTTIATSMQLTTQLPACTGCGGVVLEERKRGIRSCLSCGLVVGATQATAHALSMRLQGLVNPELPELPRLRRRRRRCRRRQHPWPSRVPGVRTSRRRPDPDRRRRMAHIRGRQRRRVGQGRSEPHRWRNQRKRVAREQPARTEHGDCRRRQPRRRRGAPRPHPGPRSAHVGASHDVDRLQDIERIAARMSLPQKIVDWAQELLRRAEATKELGRQQHGEALAAACVFVTCRQSNVPRTIKELCGVADVRTAPFARCIRKLKALKVYKTTTGSADGRVAKTKTTTSSASEQLIARFASTLKLDHQVVAIATRIVQRATELGVVEGKHPATITATALYLACQHSANPADRRTAEQIGLVASVAASTIVARVRDMTSLSLRD